MWQKEGTVEKPGRGFGGATRHWWGGSLGRPTHCISSRRANSTSASCFSLASRMPWSRVR